jgi:hypothetical protein
MRRLNYPYKWIQATFERLCTYFGDEATAEAVIAGKLPG